MDQLPPATQSQAVQGTAAAGVGASLLGTAEADLSVLRPWLLAAAGALLVVSPLLPGESAARAGDGLPAVMLWIAVVVGWLLGAIGRERFAVRVGWIDVAVLGLIAWHSVAAIVAAAHGAPRPAVNMLWQWIGLGLAYFAVRQFQRTPREARAMAAAMIAVAAAVAGYGLYHAAVEMPDTRAAYAADPEGMMRAAGVWYPPGSPDRALFEARLKSPEPTATFALTNSLAGFLAPWLVLLAGVVGLIVLETRFGRATPAWFEIAVLSACLLLLGVCLLLTHSRSAVAAAAVGLAAAAWAIGRRRWPISWKWAAAAALAATVATAILVVTLDGPIAAGARKSLGYRLEYWQATARMIADHPWLGVGPGNFQNAYTGYKLPEASEEVGDPHNFLLEVWATAGTPAAVALIAVVAGALWLAWRSIEHVVPTPRADEEDRNAPSTPAGETPGRRAAKLSRHKKKRAARDARRANAAKPEVAARGPIETSVPIDGSWFVLAGAVAGFALFVPLSALTAARPNVVAVLATLPLAGVVVVGLWRWVAAGRLPPLLLAAALIALLVDLSAAGGIGFPGVATSLWLLVALVVNGAQRGRAGESRAGESRAGESRAGEATSPFAAETTDVVVLPRWAAAVALALAMALAAACYLTAYQPVLVAQGSLRAAQRAIGEGRTADAIDHLETAAAADPLAYEPWRQLAESKLRAWLAGDDQRLLRQAVDDIEEGLRRANNSSFAWQTAGDQYLAIAEARTTDGRLRQPTAARDAVAAYQRAVDLYPTSPLLRAKLALAHQLSGEPAESRLQAAEALRLDALTPHADKKLPGQMRERLQTLLDGGA